MFENLGWTFKREPILYIGLLTVVLQLVQDVTTGGVDLGSGIIFGIEAILTFVARGLVTPYEPAMKQIPSIHRKGGIPPTEGG